MINSAKLLDLRRGCDFNLAQLAVKLGLSGTMVYKLETTPHYNPKTKTILKYVKYFNVAFEDLVYTADVTKEVENTVHVKTHNKEHILSIKQEPSMVIGIYFLIYKDEIVYVGRSKNVYVRFCAHKMPFDSYTIIPCKEEVLKELERQYITKFKPKHNYLKTELR